MLCMKKKIMLIYSHVMDLNYIYIYIYMIPFFNRTWLERVGVAGLNWNWRRASLQAPDVALLYKDKKERAGRGFARGHFDA